MVGIRHQQCNVHYARLFVASGLIDLEFLLNFITRLDMI